MFLKTTRADITENLYTQKKFVLLEISITYFNEKFYMTSIKNWVLICHVCAFRHQLL